MIEKPTTFRPAVDGDDHLRHGGHADDVGPDHPQEAILGPRLQVRPRHGDEHALVGDDVLAAGDFEGPLDQLLVVGLAHVGEARAEAVVVDADQRVVAQQVDVVVDQHDVAALVVRVHAAAGVADDEQLRAQGLHHAHGQRDLLERIALVHVEAAFHRHDGQAGELAADQPAAMAGGRAAREVRNRLVLERGLFLDVLRRGCRGRCRG